MSEQAVRVGVVAGGLLQAWQRDALAALRISGVEIAARFAPEQDHGPDRLPPVVEQLAGDAAECFAPTGWDAPALAVAETAASLDAVLFFAAPHAPELLAQAGWGTWEVVLPGEPPGYAAVERGDPVVEVRVERVTKDGNRTVLCGAAAQSDPTSYAATLRVIAALAVELPATAVRRAAAGVAGEGPVPAAGPPVDVTPLRAARLSARGAVRRAVRAVKRRMIHSRWRLGVLRTPAGAIIAGTEPRIAWLDLPSNRFWADPFPLVRGDKVEVLCEGYDYRQDRGYLARIPLDGVTLAGEPQDLARMEHHLSYPYVVEDGDERFVMPEQSQARRVALYRVDAGGLHETCVLLDGIAAVDPTLIRHGDRWWLFMTDAADDDNGALLLFHAPSLDATWTPHPLNPIVRDVRCARPAGTPFSVDGTLYRPAQDCSTSYGARVALARVDILTPDAYRETVVAHLEPPRHGRGRRGLHTLAMRGGICLVDGKDEVFDPAATLAMLAADLRRISQRIVCRNGQHTLRGLPLTMTGPQQPPEDSVLAQKLRGRMLRDASSASRFAGLEISADRAVARFI